MRASFGFFRGLDLAHTNGIHTSVTIDNLKKLQCSYN